MHCGAGGSTPAPRSSMDFSLTPEQELIRASAREFCKRGGSGARRLRLCRRISGGKHLRDARVTTCTKARARSRSSSSDGRSPARAPSPRREMPRLNGKVAVVTGAGRGIGREHAIALAQAGAKIVVNDLGASLAGEGADAGPAHEVVREIEALGGEAVANGENVADFTGAKRLIDGAIAAFGHVDILINNAGILRDRMLVNMEEHEWDAVIEVHLKGHFAPTRHAAAYWRERSKAGDTARARVICTSSPSGVFGNVGQVNYGAAKGGIAAFTLIAAQELQRYGVTVNCLAPNARTRMTERAFGEMTAPDEGVDA